MYIPRFKDQLRREAVSTSDNQERVAHYYLMRRLLEKLVVADPNIRIFGSFAYPIHTKEFRLPSDLDIESDSADNTKRITESLLAKFFSADEINVLNSVVSIKPEGNWAGDKKVTLPPVLSIDQPLTINSNSSVNKPMAQAITRGVLYPGKFKSSFDIFSLAQAKTLNMGQVRKHISEHQFYCNPELLSFLKEEISEFIKTLESDKFFEIYERGEKELPATSEVTPQKIVDTYKKITKELKL